PFTERQPAYTLDTLAGGTKKQVFYALSGQHNYRVSMPGKITHVGRFTPSATKKTIAVAQEQLDSRSPTFIDHDVNSLNGRNHSDVFLNINAAGHLRMAKDSTFYLMNIRVWQAINSDVDNYFIEPDFRYSITSEQGVEDNSVVQISADGTLTAVGAGTAIVRVTYDAMMVDSGTLYSALWPENTGVFVVTVSDAPDAPATGISSNMHIGEYWNTDPGVDRDTTFIDAEGDILYYDAASGGFDLTFKPDGVASVTLAQPVLHDSILSYPGGFSAGGVTPHPDGSYTVRVVHGRNIVKLTNARGESEYQVVSAKPATWTVNGASGAGGVFRPGDTVNITFGTPGSDGKGYPLYHPHNKLAGIYNMSAGIQYTSFETNFPLILGPGQYTFASRAQGYSIIIPSDYAEEELALTNGTIKVRGYGSAFPAHRAITKKNGVPPNLNAGVRNAYFGSLPSFYFRLVGSPGVPEQLTATPEGETVLNLSWLPSRDNGSVDGYMVYVNGKFVDIVDTTFLRLENLTPGTQYLIEVEAMDNDGLKSSTRAQVTAATHDFAAPTAPANVRATGMTETTATLAWSPSSDNSGVVAGYVVYTGSDSVALSADTVYTVTGLSVVTPYSFTVTAVDASGNRSAASQPLSVTTPDQTAPSKPGRPIKVDEADASVTLSWTRSTDNVGVAGYLVTLNGDSVSFVTANRCTVSGLPSAYFIGVQAVDAAGNRSEPAYHSSDDNEAPSVPAGLVATADTASITLTWTASTDNLIVAGYVVYLNDDSVATVTSTSYTFANLTDGTEYALAVAAFDAAGNRSAQATATVTTVDVTPPSVPANLAATPASTSIALTWVASTDNVGVAGYVVYLNGDSVATVTDAAYTFANLTAETEYTLGVAAFDAAGNRSDTAQVTATSSATSTAVAQQATGHAAFAYPNPFGSYLVVEAAEGGEVVIYTLQGRLMLRAAVGAGSNSINVSSLPQGVYIVRCGSLSQLLVKQE
ncbi:MAG: fibronectin type III domain-containing protein, partial [Prevotellaceae bacterium]|nr:fibronectin type III domain-containing protein [Prevotellaceae bacterium]